MSNLLADKSFFDQIFGISCVENLVMYALRSCNYPYQYLYYKSFLPFAAIEKMFINDGVKYPYFHGVERIQDLAQRENILDIQLKNTSSPQIYNDWYTCVMVKPDFIHKRYRTSLLRNDHYMLLDQGDGEDYIYINDTPRDISIINRTELTEHYSGSSILFKLRGGISEEQKKSFRHVFLSRLQNRAAGDFSSADMLLAMRDVLGIYRILMRRTDGFVKMYSHITYLEPFLHFLDVSYSKIEYMRLRNITDKGALQSIRKEIIDRENDCISQILCAMSNEKEEDYYEQSVVLSF